MRTSRVLATAGVVILALGGCSNGGDELTEERLAEQLVEQGLFEQAEAECVADGAFAELDAEELDEVRRSFGGDGPLPESFRDALTTAVIGCVDDSG